MDAHQGIKLLVNFQETDNKDFVTCLDANLTKVCSAHKINSKEIHKLAHVKNLTGRFESEDNDSVVWKFVCVGFHYLITVVNNCEQSTDRLENLLSVEQCKNIRKLLDLIVTLGMAPNFIPGVGIPLKARCKVAEKIPIEDISIIEKYVRIRACAWGFLICSRNDDLRQYIVTCHLNDFLVALIQISYAPLRQPMPLNDSKETFQMTLDLYEKLHQDKTIFGEALKKLYKTVYPPTVIKELMVLMGHSSPPRPKWLKIYLSKTLQDMIMKQNGIMCVALAMFESYKVDTGICWQEMLLIQKLIFQMGDQMDIPNFYKKVCSQLLRMVGEVTIEDVQTSNLQLILSRVLINGFREHHPVLFNEEIMNVLVEPLLKCVQSSTGESDSNVVVSEDEMAQCLRNLYKIFVIDIDEHANIPCHEILYKFTEVLYQIYSHVYSRVSKQSIVATILVKILSESTNEEMLTSILKSIVFAQDIPNIYKVSRSLEFQTGINSVKVCLCNSSRVTHAIQDGGNALVDIVSACPVTIQVNLFSIVFKEFTYIFSNQEIRQNRQSSMKYKQSKKNYEIASLVSLKILALLCVNKQIMAKIDQSVLISFLEQVIASYQNVQTPHSEDSDSLTQSLLLLDMILSKTDEYKKISKLLPALQTIENRTKDEQLKQLINRFCNNIKLDNDATVAQNPVDKSALEIALDEVYDPLIPVRAHGLMALTKLVQEKDPTATCRKKYLLCIFQENLKNPDSYIYLTAIKGLVALTTTHPDSMIEILADDFVTEKPWSKEDNIQVRLKIGEVLVKAIRSLGDKALNYKTHLLNTFLCGTRDHERMIRVSSFSNLGELCQVLGYRLGNIIHQILDCVHAALTTEKEIMVLRSATMVICQVIQGLDHKTLHNLGKSLLPTYHMLRRIYDSGEDSVMALHAQLALEELDKVTVDLLHEIRSMSEDNLNVISANDTDAKK